jgi:hypothetical protein
LGGFEHYCAERTLDVGSLACFPLEGRVRVFGTWEYWYFRIQDYLRVGGKGHLALRQRYKADRWT